MKKNNKLIIGILSVVAIICVAAVFVVTGTTTKKSDYDKHIAASEKYLDELNYEKAIAELELAIEIEPNKAEAYIALAEMYVEMGEYESAIYVLEEAKEKVDDVNDVNDINSLLYVVKKIAEKQEQLINVNDLVIETNEEITIPMETVYNYFEDGSYDGYAYDDRGRLVRETWYAADGSVYMYGLKEYDDDGNKISDEWYDGEGNSVNATRTKYEFFESGGYRISEYEKSNVVKGSVCRADGSLECLMTYEYDANDNIVAVKSSAYEADGNLEHYTIYEYDTNGNTVKSSMYEADGTLIDTW